MLSAGYYIATFENRDIIIHEESGLGINVYNLIAEPFIPTPGELQIFGDHHGKWLAFETEGWAPDNLYIFQKRYFGMLFILTIRKWKLPHKIRGLLSGSERLCDFIIFLKLIKTDEEVSNLMQTIQ